MWNYKTGFTGEWKGRMMIQAMAGSMTGIGEVVLLLLEVLKIKQQVNPDVFHGRGIVKIFMEGTTLYRGWSWAVACNTPGPFAVGLFPTPAALPFSDVSGWRSCSVSASVVRRSQRIVSSACQTIAKRHGHKTLTPL